MKIVICGKGGSGKSTITALLAKSMEAKNRNVLVVDMDESNTGLHRYLGMSLTENLLESVGGKSEYGKKVQAARFARRPSIFEEKWTIENLSQDIADKKGNIRLLSIGKIQKFGEGCACPIGTLSKQFFDNFILKENDVIIMDTAAGIEHFGRSVEKGFDIAIIIVDPSYESVSLSKRLDEAAKGNVTNVMFVLNKVEEKFKDVMMKDLDINRVAAIVYKNEEIFAVSVSGRELAEIPAEIDVLAEKLLTHGS